MSARRIATLVVALALCGCAGPGVQTRLDGVKADLERARAQNAYTCAPKELALAESNVAFAQTELDEGDFVRAGQHVDVAIANTSAALVQSQACAQQARPDKDRDLVPDDVDQCPEVPEDVDGERDDDGRPDVDADSDGIEDCVASCAAPEGATPAACDKCAGEPEDKDGWQDDDGCPEADNDGDGLVDTADACPNEAGPVETHGCPDRDADTIIDVDDKCPDEKGVDQIATNPLRHGCPRADRDGDGILDEEDKCPDEVGVLQPEDPAKNGCPKKYTLIVVKKDSIEIKQQVLFETGKAKIKPASFKLLAEVGDAIRSSQLSKVFVDGHTDDVGNDAYNLKLSQQRADAVRQRLIDAEKIDPGVLVSTGYGETKPLASNRTRAGKAQNRRVEFRVERD